MNISSSPQDKEHLKLLSIFHYIVSGITAFFACIPLIHLGLGIFMLVAPEQMTSSAGEMPPRFVGILFTVLGALFILAGWTLAILIFLAGRNLSKLTGYRFCFVIACLECLFMPFGTVLGVFTLLVLSRASVKELFE